nr:unnamed protein product [Callosobruchus analis]
MHIPEEYEDLILTSRKKQPFSVKQFRYNDVIDFMNWRPDYYKKTCSTLNQGDGPKRETFAMSSYKQFLYESSSTESPKTWEYIDGLHSDIIKLLKEHKENPPLPNNGAYKDPEPINEKKIADIKKVMRRIQGESLQFYYHVISWKTRNTGNDDSMIVLTVLMLYVAFTIAIKIK